VSDPPVWQPPDGRRDAAATVGQLRNDLRAAFDAVGGSFLRGLLCCCAIAAVPLAILIAAVHGAWYWGVVAGVPAGMLVSLLAEAHEERLGHRAGRFVLRRLGGRAQAQDATVLAAVEWMLGDADEARMQHRIRRDAMWHATGDLIAGFIDLSEAEGLDMTAARIAWTLNRRATCPVGASSADAPAAEESDAAGREGDVAPPAWSASKPFTTVGITSFGGDRRRRPPGRLAWGVRWLAAWGTGVAVVWAAYDELPLDSATVRLVVAVGLGLLAWKSLLILPGCESHDTR
jgi:hypothetical protein